jgi:hypothetical protein
VSIETETTALDVFAELSGLADRVQDFAHQVFVGQLVRVAAGEATAVVGFEFVDLAGGGLFELVAHRVAGFQLLGIDQDGVGAVGELSARDVAENVELAGDDGVGDALLVEAEMPRGFLEGRVDDRVFDDNLRHGWAAFQRVRHGRRCRG